MYMFYRNTRTQMLLNMRVSVHLSITVVELHHADFLALGQPLVSGKGDQGAVVVPAHTGDQSHHTLNHHRTYTYDISPWYSARK